MHLMNLKSWVEAERGRALKLAKDIDVPASFISKMVAGSKAVPLERCVSIERATEGAVSRRDLRPDDWQDIWPELAEQHAPAPAQNPPADTSPGAAAGGDTGAAWGGVERRDPDAGPIAFPDLERRAEVL